MKHIAELRAQLAKRWQTQRASWLLEQGAWPLTFTLDPPTDKEVQADPGAARDWLDGWRSYDGQGQLIWQAKQWARMGSNTICTRIDFASAQLVAQELGQLRVWQRVVARCQRLVERWAVLSGNPLLGRHWGWWEQMTDDDFDRLMVLLGWIEEHPLANCYLRELPIAGLDTKWLEERQGLVKSMAIAIGVLPVDCGDLEDGMGLKRKPVLVRFRLLCPDYQSACLNLDDLTLPVTALARLPIAPRNLLIVENEQTFLALPRMADTVALYGRGYAVSAVSEVPWLFSASTVAYWGDIDTHGFNMLVMARGYRRDIHSVLMDLPVWGEHKSLGSYEKSPAPPIDGNRLEPHEQEMLQHLKELSAAGSPINRLEQERLPWPLCLDRLHQAFDSN